MIKFKVEGKNGFLILQGTDTTLGKQRKVAIPVSDLVLVYFDSFARLGIDTDEDVIGYLKRAGVIISKPGVKAISEQKVICIKVKGYSSEISDIPGCIRSVADYVSADSATKTMRHYWYGEANEVLSNYFFGE
jgi:hypothetical protein